MGRTQLASISSILGLLLFSFGLSLVLINSPAQAQDEEREYVGARECRSCHRTLASDFAEGAHFRTVVAADDETPNILADFSTGEEFRMVQLPNVAEPRPFTANDVAFTLGSGRNIQRYLYLVEDGVYMVLPAEWNTQTSAWQAYTPSETWPSEAYNFNTNCSYCHVTGLNQETFAWEEEAVQCEACHGAGSAHVELIDDIEFIFNEEDRVALHESINNGVDPATCGQCHAYGVSDTAHPFPNGYTVGGDLSAAWTLDTTEHWLETGQASHANMQYNEWLQSGHATADETAKNAENFALECLSCHNSAYRRALRILDTSDEDPEALPIPDVEAERLPFGVTCSTCHNPHDDSALEEDYDARAANYAQCVDCHQSSGEIAGLHHPVREVFEGLPIVEAVSPVVGAHFSDPEGPTCVTCHMPTVTLEDGTTRESHILNPVSAAVEIDAVQAGCIGCHDTAEGQDMQGLVESIQASTEARYTAALAAVTADTPQWVSDALMVVVNEGSWGMHNVNYTDALLKAAEVELGLVESGIAPLELPQVPTIAPEVIESAAVDSAPSPILFGLTLPALIFLGMALAIISIAGFAFFSRKDEA